MTVSYLSLRKSNLEQELGTQLCAEEVKNKCLWRAICCEQYSLFIVFYSKSIQDSYS